MVRPKPSVLPPANAAYHETQIAIHPPEITTGNPLTMADSGEQVHDMLQELPRLRLEFKAALEKGHGVVLFHEDLIVLLLAVKYRSRQVTEEVRLEWKMSGFERLVGETFRWHVSASSMGAIRLPPEEAKLWNDRLGWASELKVQKSSNGRLQGCPEPKVDQRFFDVQPATSRV
ncbi:hypothetical protein WAI453_006274 [Rhynchosporium graminicola]